MDKLSSIIGRAKDWVESNIDNSQVISSSLFEKMVQAKIYENSKDKRATLAVYGESQIGKSYLMSRLFKHRERFFIRLVNGQSGFSRHIVDGRYVDFLNSINPSGGRESSGVVTRFTSSTSHQKSEAPIKVTFLRQIDLAMIIADTYSMDFDKDDSSYTYEDMVKLFQELSQDANSQQNGMSEDDVVEFKLYIQKYLLNGNDVAKLINRARLWDNIIKILPKLPWSKRYLILEVFWGRNEALSQLFNYLSGVLRQLSFIEEANLSLDSLIPKKVAGAIPASIIDVGTVKEVITRNKLDKRLNIYTENGRVEGFYIGDITAITKELILTIDDRVVAEKAFLADVDVLDFPGARNRKKFDINRINEIDRFDSFNIDDDTPLLHECFVRGKVSYLFNNYSDNLEITTLIFAQKYGNQEVNSLPKQIDNWVVNTHGASSTERSGKENNLFISFHFFNVELDGKSDEVDGDITQYEEYWHNRFKTNVEKFISQQIRNGDNWIADWSNNRGFKNFLLLRDPNFQKSVIMENGVERYITDRYRRRYEDLKRSFVTSSIVRKFVDKPQELWENSTELGKTGVSYIIKNVFGVTRKEIRLRQIDDRLSKLAKETHSLIEQYYQSGDYGKVLQESKRRSNTLIKELIISMQNHNSFGYILDSLNIEEALAWKTLFDLNNPIFSYEKGQSNSFDGNGEGEVDIDLEDLIDTLELDTEFKNIFSSDGRDEEQKIVKRKSRAENFADMLLQNWEGTIREKLEPRLQSLELSNDSFEWLIQILKESGRRVEIDKKIADANAKFIERYVGNEDIIYLIARVAKNYLNRHINTIGWGYISIDDRPSIDKRGLSKVFHYYSDQFVYTSPTIEDIERLIQEIFDKKGHDFYFVGSNFFKEWLKALQEATYANVEFKFQKGGVVVNPQENDKLGQILQEIEKF